MVTILSKLFDIFFLVLTVELRKNPVRVSKQKNLLYLSKNLNPLQLET